MKYLIVSASAVDEWTHTDCVIQLALTHEVMAKLENMRRAKCEPRPFAIVWIDNSIEVFGRGELVRMGLPEDFDEDLFVEADELGCVVSDTPLSKEGGNVDYAHSRINVTPGRSFFWEFFLDNSSVEFQSFEVEGEF